MARTTSGRQHMNTCTAVPSFDSAPTSPYRMGYRLKSERTMYSWSPAFRAYALQALRLDGHSQIPRPLVSRELARLGNVMNGAIPAQELGPEGGNRRLRLGR
jgi:hypothetical protein